MKKFDFEFAKKIGQNHEYLKWLENNKNKVISEDEFVGIRMSFKKFRTGASYEYSPSHCKKTYRNLVKKFGFFQG